MIFSALGPCNAAKAASALARAAIKVPAAATAPTEADKRPSVVVFRSIFDCVSFRIRLNDTMKPNPKKESQKNERKQSDQKRVVKLDRNTHMQPPG
mmetsp:Transcript_10832/g.20968  ORF Transcript_10832/g.20968 Transcript_10832/m.20968 type:complete len:96 (-) Transcript_10832:20-307(-)